MASHNYWLKRASLQDSLMRATEDETIRRINDQLAILEDDLVKEIHTFYSRYAQDNRMTQADAMKYLTDDELKEFQNVNLARFREMALDPKTDHALLDALSYRHRISRKQAMIHEIQRRTREVYSSSGAISATVGKGLASGYIKTATQVGKDMAQAGILSIKPAIKLNDDLILRRMSSKWSGKEFSSRVWTQGQEHFNSIRETLDKAFTGGWSLDKTVLELRKRTGVARYNAERLVRTEMTAYNTMANYDMYKALGAKTYKIEAILDSKTSAICRHQNNKVYLMDDFAPGTTAPPFHVHCRSKIIPTTPGEESEFLESHGYGSPDDFSSDVDQDGQSTSGRKPSLDEVVQMYADRARELSEKYGLQTVEQVQAIRNSPSEPDKHQADALSKEKLAEIAKVERAITKDMKRMAKESDGYLAGLEFRLKSQESLARKIISDSINEGISLKEAASKIRDVLRYTTIFDGESFVENYETMNKLLNSGEYGIIKVKNTWPLPSPYKGVNTTLEKDGTLFEMQYHTKESFDLKNGELHKLYEEFRKDGLSDEERASISKKMFNLSNKLNPPRGIENIKSK